MSYDENEENLRRCPTCRSMISVMATRCKHCGETVSRPKTEEERFTVRDLGGVSTETYRMSDSVIGALEAFREEELNSPDPAETFHTPTFGGRARDAINLDAAHKALADAVAMDPQERARRQQLLYPKRRGNDTLRTGGMILGGIVLAVIVLFGGIKIVQHYGQPPEDTRPPRVNNALQWLNDGQHTTLQALEEAVQALQYENNAENRQIADTVRSRLEQEVRGLVYAVPWSRAAMSEASAIANRASAVDADRRISDLREEVQREVATYKLSLTEINTEDGTATFKLNDPYYEGPAQQTVEVGDYLAERFLINAIRPDQVEFTDERVKDELGSFRRLRVRVLEPIRGM